MVAENLELFAEDVDRYIEDKKKQKVPQTVIENHKNQLSKVREDATQVSYPSTPFTDLARNRRGSSANSQGGNQGEAEIAKPGREPGLPH